MIRAREGVMNTSIKTLGRSARAAILAGMLVPAMAQVPADPYNYSQTVSFERDAATGLVTAEIVQPNHPQLCLRTEYTYDAFGNRRTTTQRNCTGATGTALFTTRVQTDDHLAQEATPAGLTPTVITNAEGHVERRQIDTRFGGEKVSTDANALSTTVTYDDFGRKTLEVGPDGNRIAWVYSLCSTVGGPDAACGAVAADGALVAYYVRATPQNSAGVTNGPVATTFYDTEGRPVRAETQAYAAGAMRTRVVVHSYDGLGRQFQETGPYFEGDDALEWVNWTHDALGRVGSEIRPNTNGIDEVAITTTVYNGRFITQANYLGQNLTKERNEFDRVIRVTDTQGNQISYQHDAFGNITRVRDPLGNLTTLTYDLRGRKVGIDDPNMGVWAYEVDAVGQMVRQTSPKSLVATSTYDRIGRLTRRLEPDLDSTWYFDRTAGGGACGVSVTQLCESTTTTGYRRLNTFDAFSRINRTSTTLMSGANGTFVSKVDYESNGRIARETWPTGLAVQRNYNAQGVLLELRNAASNDLYWQRQANNARGEFVSVLTGNSLVSRTIWDLQTGNVMVLQAGPTASVGSVVNQTYAYNGLNNLTSRADVIQGLSESFGYDSLNRVVTQALQGPAATRNVTYRYDALGNITYNSDVGTYNYVPAVQGAGPKRPHAVRTISGQAGKLTNPVYSYDAHGNIEQVVGANGVTRTHAWTSFDMPQSLALSQEGVSTSFLYGPEHQRVRQTIVRSGQTKTVLYLHPDNEGTLYFERELQGTGGVATNRHYLTAEKGAFLQIETPGAIPDDPVATNLTGMQMRYWHKDHLGSVAAVTDGAGSVMERLAYEPFGKRRQINGAHDQVGAIDAVTTKRGFTGHEHLDEVDYIHMNGRIYDPDIARFLSPDPTVPYFHHLQSFNRYSYTRNNPLNRVDPNGFSDGGDSEGSSDSPESSLGNSLSKESVAKGIGDLGKGNATSPAQQGNTKGPKAPAGDALEGEEGRNKAKKAVAAANDIANYLSQALEHGYTFFATGPLGKLAGYVGTKAVTTTLGSAKATAGFLGLAEKKVAEKVAEKVAQNEINATRAVHTLEAVEITGVRAAAEAKALHAHQHPISQRMRTTAVVPTAEGIEVVSSSTRRLTRAQRKALGPNQVEGIGVGHAEVTAIAAAESMGLTPLGAAASRGICGECAKAIAEKGLKAFSKLK